MFAFSFKLCFSCYEVYALVEHAASMQNDKLLRYKTCPTHRGLMKIVEILQTNANP